MKYHFIHLLIFFCIVSACETGTNLDLGNLNTIDLTRITGQEFEEASQFDTMILPAVITAAVIAAIGASSQSYNSSSSDAINTDTEWIE